MRDEEEVAAPVFSFPPFELDAGTDTLRRGRRLRRLRPKAAAVLRHLIEHAGEAVTPEDLLAALWSGVKVSPGVLKVYVWEIRRALGDRRAVPRFVETVPRRGYRWIAPVAILGAADSSLLVREPAPGRRGAPAVIALVGRETPLASLQRSLARAQRGERQIVFVTGEAGIGKTALVEAFLRLAAARSNVRIATGHCIEHYGAGEAYLPVLSSLAQLGRGSGRRPLVRVLERHAPTWLTQLPSLRDAGKPEHGRRETLGTSRERMLRELAEALEKLTARRGLVLLLEDLQWSDSSTLDLISFLARRSERSRLLLVATYRPVDVARGDHPLAAVTQELAARSRCTELPLSFLGEADVAGYLVARRPSRATGDGGAVRDLARAIHERTEGNPLFMVNVVEDLLATRPSAGLDGWRAFEGTVDRVRRNVPASLRQLLERRIARLVAKDQSLLEAASAAGAELSAAALGAALALPVEEVEERCARLARSTSLLRPIGTSEWPDGTVAARFGFVHSLYQSVLYERLTPARRRKVHQRIAERMEQALGEHAAGTAAELASHFEQGRDLRRAEHYLELAAENALRKHANLEAASHLTRAIALLRTLPDTPERTQHELALQVRLGAPLLMTRGYTAPEVVAAYSRALELCQQIGESPQILFALAGLYRFALVRLELRTAKEIGEQVLRLAQQVSAPIAFLAAHLMLGVTYFGMGEFVAARTHLEEGLALYEPSQRPLIVQSFGDDPGVVGYADLAMVLWFLGHPEQALERSREALACAHQAGIPYSLAFALNYSVWCRLLRGEGPAGRPDAEALLELAHDNGFQYWVALGTALLGWVLIEEGRLEAGVEQIREGLAAYAAIGAELVRPWHLAKLADAHARLGRMDEAARALDEALASMRDKEEHFYEPELYRLQGELVLRGGSSPGAAPGAGAQRQAQAEACFRNAIDVARRQSAKSLELRAVLGLSRLWQKQGKRAVARKLLAETYRWFSEGFDTGDLREARALLAELSPAAS